MDKRVKSLVTQLLGASWYFQWKHAKVKPIPTIELYRNGKKSKEMHL